MSTTNPSSSPSTFSNPLNNWKQQGAGVVGPVTLNDGTRGRIVLIGPRNVPGGAMAVLQDKDGGPVKSLPLTAILERLAPADVVANLCAQERQFGESGLPALNPS